MFCHITALPGTRSYCGQFIDPETDKFIDFLSKSKQTHWIMNPLSAVGPDLSPYNASGRFSRNKYLVNLGECTKEEYGKILKPNDLPDDVTSPVFTLEMLQKQKDPRFKKAYNNFKKLPETTPIKQEYNQFCKDKGDLWLDTYSTYNALSKRHGDNFVTQRIPIAAGIGKSINKAQPNNSSNPKNLNQYNVTLLTGNHDYASLREYVDLLLTEKPKTYKDGDNSPKLFREFCKKELKLNNKQMEDKENVAKKTLIWHYQQPVKRVDTTISDTLGIYFRPNYPGHWLGEEDVYLKKPEPHALVRPWSNVFEKGFLNKPKTNPPGLKPGYKEKADEYIKTMQDLFG